MTTLGWLRRRPLVWLLAALGLVALVAWQANAWNRPSDPGAAGSSTSGNGDTTGLTRYPVGDRPQAPHLEGTTLDGEPLALDDLAGNVLVLNIWGSWCGPCRAEAPTLARLARETADEPVKFVGIDTRDTTAAAQAFVRAFKIAYPSLVDTNGEVVLAFHNLIPLSGVPSTLVVDAAGGIAAKVVGQVDYTTLRGLIDDELATSRQAPTTPSGGGGS
ncbi:MAG: TlpA disulfide reductase family protein [Nocardioidaceae bacterium]